MMREAYINLSKMEFKYSCRERIWKEAAHIDYMLNPDMWSFQCSMVFFAIGNELELIYVHELKSFDGAWLYVNGIVGIDE